MSQRGLSRMTHRKYRGECESEVYHLTTRGVSKLTIFEDDEDRLYLLRAMERYLAALDTAFEVYAWCFMSNHVHMIAHAQLKSISGFMGLVLSRYARYFNNRHGRTGHLFEERFDSSPIDSDAYLLTAVRYVHCNPKGAGYEDWSRYRWSSIREYKHQPRICETRYVLDIAGGLDAFLRFHQLPNNDQQAYANRFEYACNSQRSSDDQAIERAKTILNLNDLSEVSKMNRADRNRALATLKTQLSINQIARITGIGRNIVQRAK